MRNWPVVAFLLPLLVLSAFGALADSRENYTSSGDEKTLSNLSLTIGENDRVTVDLGGTATQRLLIVVLPFLLENDLTTLPTSGVVAMKLLEGGYSALFVLLPDNSTQFSIHGTSQDLVTLKGEIHTLNIDFGYGRAPLAVSQLVAGNETYHLFEEITVILPSTASDVIDSPRCQNETRGVRTYSGRDVDRNDGILSVAYSLKGAFVGVQVLTNTLFGSVSVIPIIAIPRRDVATKERKILLAAITAGFAVGSVVLVWNLYSFGIEWDSLPLYLPGMIENFLALLGKLLVIIKR